MKFGENSEYNQVISATSKLAQIGLHKSIIGNIVEHFPVDVVYGYTRQVSVRTSAESVTDRVRGTNYYYESKKHSFPTVRCRYAILTESFSGNKTTVVQRSFSSFFRMQ